MPQLKLVTARDRSDADALEQLPRWEGAKRLSLLGVALGLSLSSWSAPADAQNGKKTRPAVPQVAARLTAAPSVAEGHPMQPVFQLSQESLDAVAKVKDYTATFVKREKLKNKMLEQQMELKFREDVFSVYMKFISPNAGREVLFVAGQNDNKLLVHEDGIKSLAGTFAFLPTDPDVLAENRHPITSLGMSNMLSIVLAQWKSELAISVPDVQYFPEAKVGQTACQMIQTKQPIRKDGLKFHMTRLYIDRQRSLPIRVEQYDFPTRVGGEPELIEEYTYLNVKPNVGLTEVDFSRKNPKYRF